MAVYIAGEAVGSIVQIIIADKLGRIRFLQLACLLATIGVVTQTASVNIGMFLAGRVIAGIAVGYAHTQTHTIKMLLYFANYSLLSAR